MVITQRYCSTEHCLSTNPSLDCGAQTLACDFPREMNRRSLLGGLFSAALTGVLTISESQSATPRRVVSLDFGITQMALSVGVVPLAVSLPDRYRVAVVEPSLPAGVVDIGGNASEPSLELLRLLKPDLILLNKGIEASAGTTLAQIAPLAAPSPGYQFLDKDPFIASLQEHEETCKALEREGEGEEYRERLAALLDQLAGRVRSLRRRPLLLLWGIDHRHAYVYVHNSIFQGALGRLGLKNAWQGVPMPLGMAAIGLEQIALFEDATIVLISGSNEVSRITSGPLWRALRPVREGRVVTLPPMWSFGLPVAERFARHLVPALEQLEAGHG